MKKCKYCNGKFKLTKKEHLIRTRNPNNPEYIFEDTEMLECTVCGFTMLTETSQFYVDSFRDKIRRELAKESQANSQKQKAQEVDKKEVLNLAGFKNTIRKWIG